MPQELLFPKSHADLPTTPAYMQWAKPEPADHPTRHRKSYTFIRSIMAVWDRVVTAAKSAAYCHGASTAPEDALDYLGETYGGLARALRDTPASYRDYLRKPGPFGRWATFGTKFGLLRELAHIGYPNARIVNYRELVDAGAGASNVVFGGISSFFFVAIFQPSPFAFHNAHWGAGDGHWGTGDANWGGMIDQSNFVNEIRSVIALVKPAYTSCRHIVVFQDTTSGLNAQLLPTGNFTVFPMNEPWERVRPSFAYNRFYTRSPLVP